MYAWHHTHGMRRPPDHQTQLSATYDSSGMGLNEKHSMSTRREVRIYRRGIHWQEQAFTHGQHVTPHCMIYARSLKTRPQSLGYRQVPACACAYVVNDPQADHCTFL
jgi:hypothetical protein